jgi:hypothetical protein
LTFVSSSIKEIYKFEFTLKHLAWVSIHWKLHAFLFDFIEFLGFTEAIYFYLIVKFLLKDFNDAYGLNDLKDLLD